jgi:hypothetical protein
MGGRLLRVAAVQMVSENGERRANLARAHGWWNRPPRAGATLVALPELFSGGYWLNEQAWDTAETQNGPTEAWLRETAHHHDRRPPRGDCRYGDGPGDRLLTFPASDDAGEVQDHRKPGPARVRHDQPAGLRHAGAAHLQDLGWPDPRDRGDRSHCALRFANRLGMRQGLAARAQRQPVQGAGGLPGEFRDQCQPSRGRRISVRSDKTLDSESRFLLPLTMT